MQNDLKVWDLPTRVFHWSLVFLIGLCWYTFKIGGVAKLVGKLGYSGFITDMDIHFWAGYGVIILVGFRLMYGLIGSTTARFTHFIKSPLATFNYLKSLFKRDTKPHAGHNPVGGLSVLALLGLSGAVGVLGLYSNDDILNDGPLLHQVGKEASDHLTYLHGYWFNILLAIVVLHVCAIFFYRFYKRDNLIKPMITGARPWPDDLETPALKFQNPLMAILVLGISAALFNYVVF